MAAFWNGFFLSLSLCMDLGLVNVATLRVSLVRGATAAFSLALGSIVGDLIYFSLAVLGATQFLRQRPVRLTLWIFGTTTLLVLAFRAAREVLRPKAIEMNPALAERRGGLVKLFAAGIGLALASPTAILWFAAVGGSVIAAYGVADGDNGRVLAIFATGFAVAGILWATAFAYGASALRKIMGGRLIQVLSFASAALFVYFAVNVFLSGLREFAV